MYKEKNGEPNQNSNIEVHTTMYKKKNGEPSQNSNIQVHINFVSTSPIHR